MKAKTFVSFLLPFTFCLLPFAGCAKNYVFQSAAPVQELSDRTPSQVPETNDFNFVEYSVTSSVRYPVVRKMDPRRIPRSQDVNAADEVPASTWFTPRLGYQKISAEELLKGPEEVGPPQPPFKITKAKTKGNSPGFHIEDNRGKKYIFKFDSGDYPALESTANLIVNRLFWGFGYNVPEDYLYYLNPEDLSIQDGSAVLQEDLDKVLTFASVEEDGRYRVTASLFVEGKILGSIPQRGTRAGDSNDKIPHENLRILRALRVFSAFTGNAGIRSDNTLDVYTGEPGKGHTQHYLLDFGEALGIHSIEKGWAWGDRRHFFSFQESLASFFTFGFPIQAWEKSDGKDPFDFKRHFDAEDFQLNQWRESTQFMPIRHAQPDDDYWAAKILAGLTEDHLKTLFEAAQNPDPDYNRVMIDFMLKRREKIFSYVFARVSPLESTGIENGALQITDLAQKLLPHSQPARYEVKVFNKNYREMEKSMWVESQEEGFEVPVNPETLKRAGNYLRFEIRREGSDRPAQFHVRAEEGAVPRLVGVVH